MSTTSDQDIDSGAEVVPPPPPTPTTTVIGDEKAENRRRAVSFLVISAGFFLANLDVVIVNVALPTIQHDYIGSTLSGLSWVLNGYAIVFAALMVPIGGLGDRIGRRTVFLSGITVFTLASVLCALAPNVELLVAARLLQAIGAAATVPTSLGLLLATYPLERRARAVGAWAAIGGTAPAFGSLIGGLLVPVDWRLVFLINLPVGVLAVLAGRRALPADVKAAPGPFPDVVGAALLIASISALTLSTIKGPEWGWDSGRVLGGFAAAAVLMALFVWRCARAAAPLLSLPLFRIPSFSMANITALLYSTSFAAMVFSYTLFCQEGWGWSPMRAGLGLVPGVLMLPIAARIAAPMAVKIGAPTVVAIGCALMAVGIGWWVIFVDGTPAYWSAMLPGIFIACNGAALSVTALIAAATSGLPPTALATGSAVVNTVRQLGMAVGVSVFIAVLGIATRPDALVEGFHRGWIATAGGAAAAAVVSLALGLRARSATKAS
jgi:EmrB/QacA subfamily drug resistance transporter